MSLKLKVAYTPLSVVAGVAVGGVVAGMPLPDILVCGLVAGGGVALFCAVAAWLFDAPMGPGLLEPRDAVEVNRRRGDRTAMTRSARLMAGRG